ncbi:MAG: STAS domain-containing protein [Phycisphaerae bacterium]
MENELVIQQIKQVTVVSFQNVSVMDSANIEALGHSLMDLVQKQDHRDLVLDFSPVRFMSSQALGILLQLKKALDEVKGRMIIVGLRPDLQKVFKITNLQKLFVFRNETDQALQDFGVYIPKV